MEKQKNDIPFEEAMKQLEEIVEGLEQGDVALEKAIDLYKKKALAYQKRVMIN